MSLITVTVTVTVCAGCALACLALATESAVRVRELRRELRDLRRAVLARDEARGARRAA